jgi:hypothetical protein
MNAIDTKTEMTHPEAREFICNHFEEVVNHENVEIGKVNFTSDFVDCGGDVSLGTGPGPTATV